MSMLDDRLERGEIYQQFVPRVLTAKKDIEGQYSDLDDDFIKNATAVKTITFQLTEDCNLNCSYCYQINKSKQKLNFEDAKKFIDTIIEESYCEESEFYYKKSPGAVIEFIGGEPLLEVELMDQIVDYFRNKLIAERHPWSLFNIISMISNGVNYMKKDTQDFLQKNKDIISFSISLDGNKELHDACRVFHNGRGSYDIAVEACKHYMSNYNPDMFTKMTLAPENIEHTFEALKNLISLGYKSIHANCIYEDKWSLKDAKTFYEQGKKLVDYLFDNNLEDEIEVSLFDSKYCRPYGENDDRNYCGSSCSMIAVDKKGDIYPCIRFMESSLGQDIQPYIIGNVESGIAKEQEHKKRFEELYAITRTSQSSDKCNSCPIGAGCGWCTALNYQVTGSVNKRIMSICEMHQARSLFNVYFWNRYYRSKESNLRFTMYIPRDWALEIVSEDEYQMLFNLQK